MSIYNNAGRDTSIAAAKTALSPEGDQTQSAEQDSLQQVLSVTYLRYFLCCLPDVVKFWTAAYPQ